MPTADLSPYTQPPGSDADGSKFDNMLTYVQGLLNGLDSANFDTNAIDFTGPSAGQGLIYNGSKWIAGDISAIAAAWQTIGATLTFSSADGHTFVATTSVDLTGSVNAGMKVKLTQTTAKYFICTKITSTQITLYGGTDYTLANAAITSPSYSMMRAPAGFPMDPAKWTERLSDNSQYTHTGDPSNTVFNLGSLHLDIPIGAWYTKFSATIYLDFTTNNTPTNFGLLNLVGALSESSSALPADLSWADSITVGAEGNLQSSTTGTNGLGRRIMKEMTAAGELLLTTKTRYYIVEFCPSGGHTDTSLQVVGTSNGYSSPSVIQAVSAYL